MKSKNVLIVIPHLAIGGTEVQTLNLARALVLAGHKVTTLCLYRNIPQMVESFEMAGSKVICVSPQYDRYGVTIAYHRNINAVLFLFKTLKKILHNEHYDVIHAQYMTPMATAILILRYLLNYRKIVVTIHTNADIYKSLWLLHHIQKHCCKAFTCITKRAEEGFFGSSTLYEKSLDIKRRNHFTIYNSLPYGMRFSPNVRREEPKVIGVVSRLEKIKGMDLVIPSFAMVHKAHPDVRLIVVGDGSLKEVMMHQAKEADVANHIEWAGRQSQDCLHQWYAKMDIVLIPSRSEGFGLTAIEAMKNGCVVVASDTGGLSEVVINGEVGLLHKVDDVADLTAKTCKLIEDKATYRNIQQNTYTHAERFSFDRFVESFSSLYEKI